MQTSIMDNSKHIKQGQNMHSASEPTCEHPPVLQNHTKNVMSIWTLVYENPLQWEISGVLYDYTELELV